jgi:hypothetical protein
MKWKGMVFVFRHSSVATQASVNYFTTFKEDYQLVTNAWEYYRMLML